MRGIVCYWLLDSGCSPWTPRTPWTAWTPWTRRSIRQIAYSPGFAPGLGFGRRDFGPMLHCIAFAFLVVAVVLVALLGIYLLLRTGFSLNGKPMRFDPSSGDGSSKTKSWYIEGVSSPGVPISCPFLKFHQRRDFL